MKQRGFTMIELMVVIVIIGVLGSLGASTYTKSLSKGRDSKRIQDMKEVQKGFEIYYAKNDTYGYPTTDMYGDGSIFPGGGPVDPSPSREQYSYADLSANAYCACASIENAAAYANSGAACNYAAASKTHYCVNSVQ